MATVTQNSKTQKPNQKEDVKMASVTKEQVREILTKYELTVRKFSNITGANYLKMLKASKAPEEGKVYDPKATNYAEMLKVLMEVKDIGKKLSEIKWEDHKTVKSANVEKDTANFKVGSKVYIRRSEKPWEIVYRSETHVVIIEEGTTEPRSWGWETFLANGPSFSPRKK